jgi:capsid protein
MAQKPRSQWSEAYRKRIERAEARGLSRQQARGHKAKEHVIRRQRERAREAAKADVTTEHKKAIRDYLRRLPYAKARTEESFQRVRREVALRGWDWFVEVRKTRAEFVRNQRKGQMPGSGYFDVVVELLELEEPELDWLLFYHG